MDDSDNQTLPLEAAFLAADERAAQRESRREFRRDIIRRQQAPSSVTALMLGLDDLAERHGFDDGIGNTVLDPSKEEIADAMSRHGSASSVDTARRAWRAAVRLGLLAVEECPGKTSIFTLLWPVMFERSLTAGGSSRGSRGSGGRGSSRGSKRGLATPAATPTSCGKQGWQHPPYMEMEMNNELHESMKDEVLEKGQEEGPKPRLCLRPGTKPEELRDPVIVNELWGRCVQLGLLPATDEWRLTFFGLCHSVLRNAKTDAKPNGFAKPVGALHWKLECGQDAIRKQVSDQHDRAWGRQAIASLETHEVCEPAAALAGAFDTLPFDEAAQAAKKNSDWLRQRIESRRSRGEG